MIHGLESLDPDNYPGPQQHATPEYGEGSVEARLAAAAAIDVHDPLFTAAIQQAKGGQWATIEKIQGTYSNDCNVQTDRVALEDHFRRFEGTDQQLGTTLEVLTMVSNFNEPTVDALTFYNPAEAEQARVRELLSSGDAFAVTGNIEALDNTGSTGSSHPEDRLRRVWTPLHDSRGQLPGYHIVTGPVESPVTRSQLGDVSYVDHATVLNPYLEVFQPADE